MKVLIVLLATCVGASAFAAPDAPSPAAPAPAPVAGNGAAELKWHHTMKEAYAAALKERKAVLLVAGADWCGPCRMLEKEMAKPAAAKAIGNVVLVHLDVDRSPEAQAFLHSGAIPLLRILSPAGQRIDMKEGFLTAEDLAKWIDQQQERALEVADELLALGEPDATSLPRLINRLSDADATLREAAIRRLLPFPTTAAPSVVDAFASGGLASRLSCLELLSQWQAPVVTLDPWKPQTITEDHIKALATWANSVKPAAPPPPVELEHAQLDEAKQAIDRMLAANDPQQVRAMRDRLARLGPALMPLVREQLKAAASDSARERLLALRYRLTASEGLMLAWPGGIERLAATEARTRHVAVEELVARAGPDDGELLLELFADPDPFVRELSLRGLNATGRGDAARAFIGLLDDPDPNVQAAVLKQLAEKPSAAMLGPVVAFIQKQTDADLIVHAVRVLRASKSASAVGGLRKLLDHPSWRVRAESAEALSELVGRYGDASAVTRADVYAAMIKLLDDPDNFVVSRAALALRTADSPQVIEPMAKAADKHPELAAELIAGMTYNSEGRAIAEKYIRQFCGHKDERLRAHAATAIVSITSDVEKEMAALLKDESLNVRAKAAMAIFALVNSARERAGDTHSADFFSDTPPPPKDMLKWIEDYRAGKDRAAWIADVIPPLRELTNQPDAATRLAGALPLLALGPTDDPYQVVKAAVAADTSLVADAAEALPWLTSPQRVELFNELLPAVIGGKSAWPVVKGMSAVRDPAAAAAMWDALGQPDATIHHAAVLHSGMVQIYMGSRYYRQDQVSPAMRDEAINKITERAGGNEVQKVAALSLLTSIDSGAAVKLAEQILADTGASKQLHLDATRVRLVSLTKAAGLKLASELLADPREEIRSMALTYLATGTEEIRSLREELWLTPNESAADRVSFNDGQPMVYSPPPRVKPEQMTSLLAAKNPRDAAYAGYLLALMGKPDGLDVLIAHWRGKPDDDTLRNLVIRAVAAVNADDKVPVLEAIYGTIKDESYSVRELYWTIRPMTGEKALLLRKKVRDEFGMQNLR